MWTMLIALVASQPLAPGWRYYNNSRFGYSLCYPPILRPYYEPDAGDGMLFKGRGAAEARVFGSFEGAERLSLEAYEQQIIDRYSRDDGQVSYRATGKTWFVVSGRAGAVTFYRRTDRRAQDYLTFEVRYPSSEQSTWGPIVTRMSRCFTYGPAPF